MAHPLLIRIAREPSDFRACVKLQREVWGLSDLEITSAIQLVATVHAGGLLLVAEDEDGAIVGFSYAFAALRGGEPHLHSDMLAVRATHRRRGLGARLKWAQREEAQRRGLRLVTWTFDPLQARNAALNLRCLGAVATEYVPDFYGPTTSALHHGLPTDRLFLRWELDSPRVARRREKDPFLDPREVLALPAVNEAAADGAFLVSSPPRVDLEAPSLRLEIPGRWDDLCRAAPERAREWQAHVTRALGAYLARGYRAVDFLALGSEDPARGLYVLSR
jgi:chorismate synthase